MRSIAARAFAPVGALVCLTAFSSVASAERALHVAPAPAAFARSARLRPVSPLVVDHEGLARVALSRVSPFAAARREALVATSNDRFGDGDTIVRFEQTHQGLPVIGRGAAVRMTSRGDALLTAVDLEEDLPSVVPSLAPSAAASIAALRSPGTITQADAHLVVWPLAGGGARLAYAVLPQIPAGIPMSPRIIVDAHSGRVLESRDMLRFAKASVHRFNPIKTPAIESLDLALTPSVDANGHLSNEFVTSSNCIDHKSVKSLSIQGFNAKVHVCDIEQVATADADGNYVYAPSDVAGAVESRTDNYAEVSMYYHAAKAYDFFRTLQGVPDAQVVVDKPLRVIANLQIPAGIASGNILAAADPNTPLEVFQNAFFAPAGGGLGAIFQQLYGFKAGALWFGQGPQRDYAYDGDVVYHELTHAVVDHTIKLEAWHIDARGAIDAPGAMNEGLADYFSSAITGDPDVGEYASKDITAGSSVIRTLANEDKCPTNVIGEVHFDSTLFSGALWSARSSLAEADRSKFDAALYKAMRTNPGRGDLGYDDLAKLFLATLGTDLPAGATALTTSMTARGVLPACERIVEPKNGSVKAIDAAIGGFASPGLQSVPQAGDLVPGIVQVHAKSAATDGKLTVSFSTKASSSGGGNPLGGGGTPFTPVALVKFGKAITWTVSRGSATHDADKALDLTAGTRPTATFEVPAGTTDVFVQIANKGDTDGAYDNLTIELSPAVDGATEETPVTAPTNTGSPTESNSSSGCSTSGQPLPSGGLGLGLGLVAGLALAAGVRRRGRASRPRR